MLATGGQTAAAEAESGGFIDADPIDARPLDGEEPDWTLYRTAEDTGTDTDMRALKVGVYDEQVGKTFITYMGAEGPAPTYVQEFNHANDKWTPKKQVGDSFDDSHNYPTMVQGDNGRLHVFHGCHNSPLRHATPSASHTVRGEWTDEAIEEAEGASYPMPFVADNGDLYVFYRETYVLGEDPGDEEYDTAYRPLRYVRSTDGGETWTNSVELTGHAGAVNDGRRDNWLNEIYAEQLHHESAGNGNPERVHFTWMISGGLDEDGEHSHGHYLQNVYYAYFTPHNLHWHTADGKDLGQSITPEEMDEHCIVENTLESDKFTRRHSVPFDKWVNVTADGRPILLYCLRAPSGMEPGGTSARSPPGRAPGGRKAISSTTPTPSTAWSASATNRSGTTPAAAIRSISTW
ncbi:hypothetical protein GCM10009000_077690 [Halobacterium noricense]|uniref:BNR repeat-containing family member n=1 Tax=Haladaptatus pallidirubidus TaxID=1008152 RepID=A0AAV3UPE6_9EURY